MTSSAFLQQLAPGHLDARGARHLRVRVLDDGVTLRILELLVLVATDAIELEQPIAESFGRFHLAASHLLRLRVPGDDRFRAGAAGGGAHLEDLRECGLALIGVAGVVERAALSTYLGGGGYGFGGLELG